MVGDSSGIGEVPIPLWQAQGARGLAQDDRLLNGS